MSLQDLEVLLKRYWEGMFKKGAGPMQPVEVARVLVREMDDKRRVSVSRVYAPNVFAVHLGSADFEETAPLQSALARELEEHILEQAEEKGFSLIGRPAVSFVEDQALEAGAIRVGSSFNAAVEDRPGSEAGKRPAPGVLINCSASPGQRSLVKRSLISRQPAGLYLTVVQGPDMGKIFSLSAEHEQQCFTIGRKMTNNIYLTDINASREHAQDRVAGRRICSSKICRAATVLLSTARGSRSGRSAAGDLIQIGENLLQIEGDYT